MMLQLRLGPLYEELLAVASERGMSPVAMARQMIQESIRRVGEPAREEHRPEPPAPSPSILFLAFQPQLLGRLG